MANANGCRSEFPSLHFLEEVARFLVVGLRRRLGGVEGGVVLLGGALRLRGLAGELLHQLGELLVVHRESWSRLIVRPEGWSRKDGGDAPPGKCRGAPSGRRTARRPSRSGSA